MSTGSIVRLFCWLGTALLLGCRLDPTGLDGAKVRALITHYDSLRSQSGYESFQDESGPLLPPVDLGNAISPHGGVPLVIAPLQLVLRPSQIDAVEVVDELFGLRLRVDGRMLYILPLSGLDDLTAEALAEGISGRQVHHEARRQAGSREGAKLFSILPELFAVDPLAILRATDEEDLRHKRALLLAKHRVLEMFECADCTRMQFFGSASGVKAYHLFEDRRLGRGHSVWILADGADQLICGIFCVEEQDESVVAWLRSARILTDGDARRFLADASRRINAWDPASATGPDATLLFAAASLMASTDPVSMTSGGHDYNQLVFLCRRIARSLYPAAGQRDGTE